MKFCCTINITEKLHSCYIKCCGKGCNDMQRQGIWEGLIWHTVGGTQYDDEENGPVNLYLNGLCVLQWTIRHVRNSAWHLLASTI